MPADLTMAEDQTYGLECPEHPEATREGLAPAHATNAVAKHNRDHHPTPDWPEMLNLSVLARLVIETVDAYDEALNDGSGKAWAVARTMDHQVECWEALTGLTGPRALSFARHLSASPDWHAAVVPF